ncbi:MAG: hypothetical protein SVY53_05750 [Chloroflexota bacterium]|nr:hypothetical protein [Chloroflexota bacterium]
MITTKGIVDIEDLVEALPSKDKEIFNRIFYINVTTGTICAPGIMHPWIEKQFGNLDNVFTQTIVKITNQVTLDGALFNKLRASRPIRSSTPCKIASPDCDNIWDDPLRDPLTTTPKDTFGRVEGKYCITASNIAKYDGLHGVISFRDYDPLQFDRDKVIDYIQVGWKWAKRAYSTDPSAKYFLFIWNCQWKAGASLEHGHAQVMLTHGMHYAKIEGLRRNAVWYRRRYNTNYFDDLFHIHSKVGCGMEKEGVRIISSLTPIKDKEILLFSQSLDLSLMERIYEVLNAYRQCMGVRAFNLALITSPFGEVEEDWQDFPVLVRIVDRGDPMSRASDMGTMELYAASVVASDPMKVSRILWQSLADVD